MRENDVRIYLHPNREIRSFLTSSPIMRPQVEVLENPVREMAENLNAKMGTIGAQTARDLLSIPGVAKIRIKPKEVIIQKAPAASWEEMEKQILRIMERAVRKSRIRVMKA
jgi:hypothetical protein